MKKISWFTYKFITKVIKKTHSLKVCLWFEENGPSLWAVIDALTTAIEYKDIYFKVIQRSISDRDPGFDHHCRVHLLLIHTATPGTLVVLTETDRQTDLRVHLYTVINTNINLTSNLFILGQGVIQGVNWFLGWSMYPNPNVAA